MFYLVHTLHFDSVKFVEACVKLEKRRHYPRVMPRGSSFCVLFLLSLLFFLESLVNIYYTAVFTNFVQFHHASPAVRVY
jgi:hypothetical protein